MNRQGQLIEILKSEGLRIVDEEGFPFESEIENDEAWQAVIDGEYEDYSDCHDNGEVWEKKMMYDEERARLKALKDQLWYERHCIKPLDDDSLWRGEVGQGLINNPPVMPPHKVRNSEGEVIPYDKWVESISSAEDFMW